MQITFTTGNKTCSAELNDSPAAQEFAARLPLTLPLKDYAGIEKIAYLDKPLDTRDAPAGHKASAGDITYYAPWGNLALFKKSFGYADGLVNLGRFTGDYVALFQSSQTEVVITLV